ncbi:hypothetical protein BJX64DRAFT_283946 [Aspergillus heterothallicus]
MVTGLEAVGVTLAVLPVIVNQLDNYAKGCEKLRGWRRSRHVFASFKLGLTTQQTIFKNTLENLLHGIVEDEDKIGELVEHPQQTQWCEAGLQGLLRQRLGRSHDVFVANMLSLHGSIMELSKRLGLDLSSDYHSGARPDLQFKWRKLLNMAVYEDLLNSIAKSNDILRTLIELKPSQKASSRRLSWGPLLRYFREARIHAQGLLLAITGSNQWTCNCRDKHRVHFKLPPPPSTAEDCGKETQVCQFTVIFSNENDTRVFEHWSWREVECIPWKVHHDGALLRFSSTQPQPGLQAPEPRRVRFFNPGPVSAVPTPNIIADICSSLSPPRNNIERQILGTLSTGPDVCFLMTGIPSKELDIGNRSLRDHLERISRRERLRIAAGLACWVIQFYGSWLKPDWTISDVQLALARDGLSPHHESLYCTWALAAESQPTSVNEEPSQTSQSLRDVLFSLGLALIELSLGKSIDDFQSPTKITANRLQERISEVEDGSGTNYARVVRLCLCPPHEMGSLRLDDSKFEERVFGNVFSPLLRELLYFEGQLKI